MGCAQGRARAMAARRSDIMEFLILLQDDDYASCPLGKSFFEKTIGIGKKLPGVLHIANLMDVNEIPEGRSEPKYVIKRLALPRVTYIKLPKEGIYVKSDEWEFEYIKSQIQEVIMVCGLMGAKSVKYDISNNRAEHKNMGANIDMGDLVQGVGAGASMSSGSGESSQLVGEVEFGEREGLDVNFEVFEKEERNGNIHYLMRMPQWISMVDNRMRRKVMKSEFRYSYRRELFFRSDVVTKVRDMGISFDYGKDSMNNFSVMFNIEYYPLANVRDVGRLEDVNVIVGEEGEGVEEGEGAGEEEEEESTGTDSEQM